MGGTVSPPDTLVIACGALARELRAVMTANSLDTVRLECLPAELHNRPGEIAEALERRLQRVAGPYSTVFIGYADCGTGGAVDRVARRWGAERLPGAHCYQFYAGADTFAELHDAEPGTFYLTDYLVRFFDRWVWQGLWLDRHPELRDAYFGNYTRLLYLSQEPTETLLTTAREAAERLGLRFEHQHVGYGETVPQLVALGQRPPSSAPSALPAA
ncbi:DUF1638 domain-containing protein [Euzebya tangerina]|uniref:DUF1638 domain-containing protein n=1 Tax=Euzebya tangerina TaxID=591198 RepID=UPI000E32434E|nr:DUF1638 domain-containing protein [Euzebya tangerina]